MPRFQKSQLALKYCIGSGIEIGASAHNAFGLNTRNVAVKEGFEFYKGRQIENCGEYALVDIWAEGDDLPFHDNEHDFLVASHVIEHMPNPIRALREWCRVVKPGGIVFVICPHPDVADVDKGKDITPLEHCLEDFKLGRTVDTHEGERRTHYHRWSMSKLLELVTAAVGDMCYVTDTQDPDDKVGNGFTIVLKKRENVPVQSPVKIVFSGYEQAGTTLITQLFRQHSDFDGGFEGGLYLAETPRDFLKFRIHADILVGGWTITNDELAYVCAATTHAEAYQRLRLKSRILRRNNVHLFDKCPAYATVLREVVRRSGVPNVFIIRDPRALISSWQKHSDGRLTWDDWPKWSQGMYDKLDNGALNYSVAKKLYPELVSLVRYEQLLETPKPVMDRLFGLVGCTFDEKYLSFSPKFGRVYGSSLDKSYADEYTKRVPKQISDEIVERAALLPAWSALALDAGYRQ